MALFLRADGDMSALLREKSSLSIQIGQHIASTKSSPTLIYQETHKKVSRSTVQNSICGKCTFKNIVHIPPSGIWKM